MFVTRIDPDQFTFYRRDAQFVQDRVVGDGRILYLLQCAPDRFADGCHATPVLCGHKMRPEIRGKATAAEYQFPAFECHVERFLRRAGEVLIFEKSVIIGNSLLEHKWALGLAAFKAPQLAMLMISSYSSLVKGETESR